MTDPFAPLPLPKDARPPEEMRILDLSAEPYADGRRVRVLVKITPFIERLEKSFHFPRLFATVGSRFGPALDNDPCALADRVQFTHTAGPE